MTGLLVSVRSAGEARAALEGGADIIDVKEPDRGSLGAASPVVWRDVAAAVAGAVPLSAALGELVGEDWPDRWLGPEYQFAKLGLAGCGKLDDWPNRWEIELAALGPKTAGVAVVYADWQWAQAPEPAAILNHGVELGCRAPLVDTFDKSRGDLFAHLSPTELCVIVQNARAAGLLVVLAGSLVRASLSRAARFEPDYLAIRGAACRGSRSGQVDASLVRECRNLVTGGVVTGLVDCSLSPVLRGEGRGEGAGENVLVQKTPKPERGPGADQR